MAKSVSCKAEGSNNSFSPATGLHTRSLSSVRRSETSGFTLIEVLVVVLVMGVLFGTGLSVYSGVTRDSQIRTRTDELTSFFAACRHRAKLRKIPMQIRYKNDTLITDQSQNLRRRVSDIDKVVAHRLFNGLAVREDGCFIQNGQLIENLRLPMQLPGGHLATITIEL